MVVFRHLLSRRDTVLLLLGASLMHLTSLFFSPLTSSSATESNLVINHHAHIPDSMNRVDLDPLPPPPDHAEFGTGRLDSGRLDTGQDENRYEGVPVNHALDNDESLEASQAEVVEVEEEIPIHLAPTLPHTTILHHTPGYTVFRNLYMSNGTLYILASADERGSLPEIRMMASTSLEADNSPENIAAREPTPYVMDIIDPEEAKNRWGGDVEKGVRNSVFTVTGNTVLFNDPPQFLRHYYHYVAELWFGAWCFWAGAFASPVPETIPSDDPAMSSNPNKQNWNAYPIDIQSDHPSTYQLHLYDEDDFDSDFVDVGAGTPISKGNHRQGQRKTKTRIPQLDRAIFMHSNADGWRDSPGFNAYFQRAAFPGMSVEHQEDWMDRVLATRPPESVWQTTTKVKGLHRDRAFHFPLVLFVDRSAAFRGDMAGSHTQRTAAQAWEYMRTHGRLRGERVGGWWEPVRDAILRFAGMGDLTEEYRDLESRLGGTEDKRVGFPHNLQSEPQPQLPIPKRPLVTYISRQGGSRRKLTAESHKSLVDAMVELRERMNEEEREGEGSGFDFLVMEAEKMTKDEQLRIIGKTTILLGPHGNGLTHLVFMPPTRMSTVIEIFYPGGFAHDYHWTSRALGMQHYAVWNDTYHTHPNEPRVDYPEGFQEDYIPVHGPTVAKIVEERLRVGEKRA
ncbi:hypothetical protein GYMLUDRAFT_409790 [Collybiopsis luxurians FD-317 M1]|uniref:Unplaced genomic scaffold GYMLUscaffold_128, whole genome shotgun sequence n=1 Tax=Collybiopsis luxurians FD-317 M1 TaxID=944289 RepID=A0A0D0ALH7_9AGAR|nr:hypothetical protein GYMLUDRAFT_409790 [Collybiopsis luxurians FD-317 M1]